MKPLSEWTRDELLVCVFESHPNAQSALGELLRRERARCLAAVQQFYNDLDAFIDSGPMRLDTSDGARLRGVHDAMKVIRELQ